MLSVLGRLVVWLCVPLPCLQARPAGRGMPSCLCQAHSLAYTRQRKMLLSHTSRSKDRIDRRKSARILQPFDFVAVQCPAQIRHGEPTRRHRHARTCAERPCLAIIQKPGTAHTNGYEGPQLSLTIPHECVASGVQRGADACNCTRPLHGVLCDRTFYLLAATDGSV